MTQAFDPKTYEEVWKPVLDYEERYEVSALGRIRTVNSRYRENRILRLHVDKQGYNTVNISHNPQKRLTRAVHRIVMEAFHGKSTLTVDHINAIKTDNRLENLEYVSSRENAIRRALLRSKNGYVGITQRKSGKWQAKYILDGKIQSIGSFDCPDIAQAAYFAHIKNLEANA